MHQDIQNFSELTGIDTQRKLVVDLCLQKHGYTKSLVKLNGFVVNVDKITFELDLFDSINLEIELFEFNEGSSGIEIQTLSVNGHEVLPKFQHLASSPTNYIDKLGKWDLRIPGPFYAWYHQISGNGWVA